MSFLEANQISPSGYSKGIEPSMKKAVRCIEKDQVAEKCRRITCSS
jgi:hypothetical protein